MPYHKACSGGESQGKSEILPDPNSALESNQRLQALRCSCHPPLLSLCIALAQRLLLGQHTVLGYGSAGSYGSAAFLPVGTEVTTVLRYSKYHLISSLCSSAKLQNRKPTAWLSWAGTSGGGPVQPPAHSRLFRTLSRWVLSISHDEWKLHNPFWSACFHLSLSLTNPNIFSPRLSSLITENH